MATKIKGKNFPSYLYLTVETVKENTKDGVQTVNVFHWYTQDPKYPENRESSEIAVERAIMDFIGNGDNTNPVLVQMICAKIVRAEAFNPSQPVEVRRGGDKHFEDRDGSVIDILETRNSSREFPLSGIVFDRKGDIAANRRYATDGSCEDGEYGHSLVCVSGPAVFETDLGDNKE